MYIKKGKTVAVIAGKDKGKTGKVSRVLRDSGRIVVEGLNMNKRRIKPRKTGEKGQMVNVASPLDLSNVMIFCDKCNKGVRSKVVIKKDKKVHVCVKCDKEL